MKSKGGDRELKRLCKSFESDDVPRGSPRTFYGLNASRPLRPWGCDTWREASRGTHDFGLQHARPQSRQILIDGQTAPAVRPRSPSLSPEGTLRLPKTGKSQTNWRQNFSNLHASAASARHYTKPSGTSHGSPPGHAFGGLLGAGH